MNRIPLRAWILSFTGIALAILFIWIAVVTKGIHPLEIDLYLNHVIYGLRTPELTYWMRLVTTLGKEVIYGGSVIILIALIIRRNWNDLSIFIVLVVGGQLLDLLLKLLVSRARPVLDILIHEPGHSFPSGHSMASFIFYTLLAYWVWRYTRNKALTWVVASLATIIILSVGVSRIYLGAHYPSDVLGAYIAGTLWIVAAFIMRSAKPIK